ncbi:hypothetical protein D9M68_723420 [compost metagenome]
MRLRYMRSDAAGLISFPSLIKVSSVAISRGVVCPQPYFCQLAWRPLVRELTRVFKRPYADINSLIAIPPPAKLCDHKLAVLSLVVIISMSTLLSQIFSLFLKEAKISSPA